MLRTLISLPVFIFCKKRSLMLTMPIILSMLLSMTGILVNPELMICSNCNSSSASITNMSVLEVMISEALVSSNSKMLCINIFSSSLISPSSSTTSTKVMSSSSVAAGVFLILPVSIGIKSKNLITGKNRMDVQYMG